MARAKNTHVEPIVDDSDDELLTKKQVLVFFGNISPMTLYRGMKLGYFPKALHITDRTRRWSKKACEKALNARKLHAEMRRK